MPPDNAQATPSGFNALTHSFDEATMNDMPSGTLIISGASQGIGLATAEHFIKQQWQVINLSRSPCPHPTVETCIVDLKEQEQCAHALNKIKNKLKQQRICIVHNAAQHAHDRVGDIAPEITRQTLEIGVLAPLMINQHLLPYMADHSSILYIGSTLSEKAVPNCASYVIAKHATVGMMRATCQDLTHPNIHTCCICPGFTDTPMLAQHIGSSEKKRTSLQSRVHAHRLIQPQEIAKLIFDCAQHPTLNGAVIHAHLGQKEH